MTTCQNFRGEGSQVPPCINPYILWHEFTMACDECGSCLVHTTQLDLPSTLFSDSDTSHVPMFNFLSSFSSSSLSLCSSVALISKTKSELREKS